MKESIPAKCESLHLTILLGSVPMIKHFLDFEP